MVMIPPFKTVKIILGISHSLAFLMTVFRLMHRCRTRRLWWDDFWAFIALLSDTFVWILYMAIPLSVVFRKPLGIQIFWKFGTLLAYTLGVWSARISIAVTIVRLITEGRFRTFAKTIVVLFGMFWLVLSGQKIFICGTRWRNVPSCPVPRVTAYIELCTSLLGDLWIVFAPAYILWRMKLCRRHRLLLMAIFSCGTFITFASIAHAYFIVVYESIWVGITGHIELGVSIVVCNLLVLVTYIYSVFRNAEEETCPEISEINSGRRPAAPSQCSTGQGNMSRSSRAAITLTDLGSNFGNTDTPLPSTRGRLYSTFSFQSSNMHSSHIPSPISGISSANISLGDPEKTNTDS